VFSLQISDSSPILSLRTIAAKGGCLREVIVLRRAEYDILIPAYDCNTAWFWHSFRIARTFYILFATKFRIGMHGSENVRKSQAVPRKIPLRCLIAPNATGASSHAASKVLSQGVTAGKTCARKATNALTVGFPRRLSGQSAVML
jgi:hypothetical protein